MRPTESALLDRIADLEAANAELQARLDRQASTCTQQACSRDIADREPRSWSSCGHGLSKEQIARYSRHLILPTFGVEGEPVGRPDRLQLCILLGVPVTGSAR